MPQTVAQRRARSVVGPSGRAAAARCRASDMRFIAYSFRSDIGEAMLAD